MLLFQRLCRVSLREKDSKDWAPVYESSNKRATLFTFTIFLRGIGVVFNCLRVVPLFWRELLGSKSSCSKLMVASKLLWLDSI